MAIATTANKNDEDGAFWRSTGHACPSWVEMPREKLANPTKKNHQISSANYYLKSTSWFTFALRVGHCRSCGHPPTIKIQGGEGAIWTVCPIGPALVALRLCCCCCCCANYFAACVLSFRMCGVDLSDVTIVFYYMAFVQGRPECPACLS